MKIILNSLRLSALMLAGFVAAVQAQPALYSPSPYQAVEAPGASFSAVGMEELATANLEGLDRAQWKAITQEHRTALRSSSQDTREAAMQGIIYLATYYPEAARFGGVSNTLYEIYRLDANEANRIMALAAMHAVGHEDTMRQLAQDVRLERSPRVRKLTMAALADYFGNTAG
jgi:hypothetical protein